MYAQTIQSPHIWHVYNFTTTTDALKEIIYSTITYAVYQYMHTTMLKLTSTLSSLLITACSSAE